MDWPGQSDPDHLNVPPGTETTGSESQYFVTWLLSQTMKTVPKEGSRMNYTTKTVRILPRAADLPNYKLDTSDESDEEPAVDRNSPLLKSTAGAGNVPSGVYNNISLMEMLTKWSFENSNF